MEEEVVVDKAKAAFGYFVESSVLDSDMVHQACPYHPCCLLIAVYIWCQLVEHEDDNHFDGEQNPLDEYAELFG